MRRIVVLRHGQTDHNLEKRAQGHLDVPLNETGRAQARRVAPLLAAYEPAFVVSSDLSRAAETAAVVAAACGVEVRTDARLREFSVGDHHKGLTWDEYAAAFPDEIALHQAGRADEIPGWETPEQVLERSLPALREVAESVPEGGTGLVVAHGAMLRTLVPAFIGLPEIGPALGGFDNCGFAVLDDSISGLLPIAAGGGWRIGAWNRVAQADASVPVGALHAP